MNNEFVLRNKKKKYFVVFLRKNLKNLALIGFCSIGIIHECWISMFKLSGVDFHGD
jgi:hypothetical protein